MSQHKYDIARVMRDEFEEQLIAFVDARVRPSPRSLPTKRSYVTSIKELIPFQFTLTIKDLRDFFEENLKDYSAEAERIFNQYLETRKTITFKNPPDSLSSLRAIMRRVLKKNVFEEAEKRDFADYDKAMLQKYKYQYECLDNRGDGCGLIWWTQYSEEKKCPKCGFPIVW